MSKMPECGAPAKQPAVIRAMERLGQSISALEEITQGLLGKLTPISSASAPPDEMQSPNESNCDLSNRIDLLTNKLQDINAVLRDQLDRLEI